MVLAEAKALLTSAEGSSVITEGSSAAPEGPSAAPEGPSVVVESASVLLERPSAKQKNDISSAKIFIFFRKCFELSPNYTIFAVTKGMKILINRYCVPIRRVKNDAMMKVKTLAI